MIVSCQSSANKIRHYLVQRTDTQKPNLVHVPLLSFVTSARWSGRSRLEIGMSILHAKIVIQTDTLSHAHVSATGVLFVCVHPHLHQHPRKQQTSPSPPNTRSPKPNATSNSRLFLSWESRRPPTHSPTLHLFVIVRSHPCI